MSKLNRTQILGATLAAAAAITGPAVITTIISPATASAECRTHTTPSGKEIRQHCTNGFPGASVVSASGGAEARAASPLAILNNGSASEVADSGTVTAGGGASVGDTVKAVPLTCGRVGEKGAASAPNSTATSGGDWVITLPVKGGPCS